MHPPLSSRVPPIVLGGAGFSDHHVLDPTALPTRAIISRAFDLGIRCIDTSPYYGPSEILLGDALSQPQIAARYRREDYILMTKVGRIAAEEFNYSREWVHRSVDRSLERLKTPYLDVVFCHDIDFVTDEDTFEAVGALLELVKDGKVRYVGVSGYSISTLTRVARKIQQRYGRSLDAVQNWAQMTLQNTRLAKEGLKQFRQAGVDCVFNSSPLAIGLLRSGGVPVGNLGDFHPAPAGLRAAAQQAAQWVATKGETFASLALRFSTATMMEAMGSDGIGGGTIFGAASIAELEENVRAAESILAPLGPGRENGHGCLRDLKKVSRTRFEQDLPLYTGVQEILGSWIDYDLMNLSRPPFNFLPFRKDGPPGNAWSLYGSSDQLGSLNLLTPETTIAAAKEVTDGVRVCTDLPLDCMRTPCFGRPPLQHIVKHTAPGGGIDDILTFNAQSSSQWDGFRHYAYQEQKLFYNGFSQEMIESSTDNGIQVWADNGGIVGRGVLLDYASYAASNNIPVLHFTYSPITVQTLKKVAESQNVTFRPSDILFVRTGWSKAYSELSVQQCQDLAASSTPSLIGVDASKDTLQWIWEEGFAAVAGDMPSFEAWPCQNKEWHLHEWLLAGWGMPIGKLFDLEKLAHECQKRRRWTFFFSSVPLRVPGGVASPPNGVAIF